MGTDHFNTYTGSGWNYNSISGVGGSFAYTGNISTGLRTVEIKIPWSALGGKPEKIAVMAWVTGSGGSAVDSLPVDPAIDYTDIKNEWDDTDTFTSMAVLYVVPKTIDGNLSDWSENELVAEDTTGTGVDVGNLSKFYISWDDQYLYIAITTENRASWRISYGIAIDYRAGGYTTGQDSWSRKVSFTQGVDAELYFFWNGEFFGDPGTSTITSAQLALWNGTGWKYEELKWVGFYAYTGNQKDGLQTLEIAIPWKALGVKPGEINVVAYVTGQGAGDSAVDSLPLQEAVKDKAPGEEWGDEDTFTEFAVVTIE